MKKKMLTLYEFLVSIIISPINMQKESIYLRI